MNILTNIFGLTPKKASVALKNAMYKVNLAGASDTYLKSSIDYIAEIDKFSCFSRLTYLFATKYKNTFEFQVFFVKSKSRKNGKDTPWSYSVTCYADFAGLPIKDYVTTQEKLVKTYPQFNFKFNRDTVTAYTDKVFVKSVKDIENAVYKFAEIYFDSNLVDTMNTIHNEYYKKTLNLN